MAQGLLFAEASPSDVLVYEGCLPDGLLFLPNFVSKSEEREIVAAIDGSGTSGWSSELRRRVQHFGYRYDYKSRGISDNDRIGDLPPWARECSDRLVDEKYLAHPPDQVIVNEYQPGQGISLHIDRDTCFGPVVASLSLCSDIVMNFESEAGKKGSALLKARSMLVLSGDARFSWKHGIASRKRDRIGSFAFDRERRISLTFRTVLLFPQDK
jgi:alkylated DNA repair dioxygenase AlkB